jgi:hypothetical protein
MGKALVLADPEAAEIAALFERSGGMMVEAIKARLECGHRLLAKKKEQGHGCWLQWLKANRKVLGFGEDAAERMMRAAANSALTRNMTEADALKLSRKMWGNSPKPKSAAADQIETEPEPEACPVDPGAARAEYNIPDGAMFMGDYVTRIGPDGYVGWYTLCDVNLENPMSVTSYTSVEEMAAAMEADIKERTASRRKLVAARRAFMDEIVKLDPDQWGSEVEELIYWLARRHAKNAPSEPPLAIDTPLSNIPSTPRKARKIA